MKGVKGVKGDGQARVLDSLTIPLGYRMQQTAETGGLVLKRG